jgi:HAD superfamily hydrolase (TIGR01549 family)
MITTLSFDLDDTLWDPRPALIAADKAQWLALAQRYPDVADRFTRDQIFVCRKQILANAPSIVGDVTALRIEVMYRLLLSLDIAPAEADESARMAFEAFMAKRNDVILFPETIPMLESVSKLYTIVAITNGNADVFKTGIGSYFDLSIRADEAGVAKPDRGIFDLTWEKVGCQSSDVIHIGDSLENDVLGAINAGVTPVWYNPDKEQNTLGVNEVSALSELSSMIQQLSDRH